MRLRYIWSACAYIDRLPILILTPGAPFFRCQPAANGRYHAGQARAESTEPRAHSSARDRSPPLSSRRPRLIEPAVACIGVGRPPGCLPPSPSRGRRGSPCPRSSSQNEGLSSRRGALVLTCAMQCVGLKRRLASPGWTGTSKSAWTGEASLDKAARLLTFWYSTAGHLGRNRKMTWILQSIQRNALRHI